MADHKDKKKKPKGGKSGPKTKPKPKNTYVK